MRFTIETGDRYALNAELTLITWSLMTCRPVRLEDGRLRFHPRPQDRSGAVTIDFDSALLLADFEAMKLTNGSLVGLWGLEVSRVLLETRLPSSGSESRLVFRSVTA